jgi:FHA domain
MGRWRASGARFGEPDGSADLGEANRVSVGRSSTDVALPWDDQVSRVHAEVCRVGEESVLADDGLSLNGTFLNGEFVGGRRAHDAAVPQPERGGRADHEPDHEPTPRRQPVGRAAARTGRALSPVQVVHSLRHTGDERADRLRAIPHRRRGKEADAGAVREVRRREPPAEREAGARRGARVRRWVRLRARPLGPSTKVPAALHPGGRGSVPRVPIGISGRR